MKSIYTFIPLLLYLVFLLLFWYPHNALADVQLLSAPWHLEGNNGAREKYQSVPANVLNRQTHATIVYDLHGRCFLGGDASALIFDQNGWKFASLANYGTNCLDGQQSVTIPLSAFGVTTSASLTGSFHVRFWNTGAWTVDIYSVTLSSTPAPTVTPSPTSLPSVNPNRPDHTVIVIEENRQLQQVLGVDYFTQLANEGALMAQSFATFHPSQPNYLELFAGTNLGVADNTCPPPGSPFAADNLGNQLLTRGFTFAGYVESLPANPIPCEQPPYAGHHLPWLYFSNVPASATKDLSLFPTDYSTLPTVSFVIPNDNNNAHDGTLLQASTWLRQRLDSYKQWAMTHNSLLIVHFDEDDSQGNNLIYTVFVGPMVKRGIYNQSIDHRTILSTLENLYGLPYLSSAFPVIGIFKN